MGCCFKGKIKDSNTYLEEDMVPSHKPTHYGFGNTLVTLFGTDQQVLGTCIMPMTKIPNLFFYRNNPIFDIKYVYTLLNSWDEHMEKVCPHLKLPWGNCFFQIPNLCILNIFNILIFFKTPLLRLLLTYIRPYLISHAS